MPGKYSLVGLPSGADACCVGSVYRGGSNFILGSILDGADPRYSVW